MSAFVLRARGGAARIAAWAKGSAWAPLAGKGVAYLLAFALLALVGSGRLAHWLTPPPHLAIGVAEAATSAPPPPAGSVAPEPSEVAVAEAPAVPDDEAPPSAAPTAAPSGVKSNVADAGTEAAGASAGVAPDGKIILNLASEDDLRKLPGIGRTKAQAILALRAQLKKFTRIEDLLKVKGIGRRKLAKLRPLVRVD